jgi:hypothetical protein
VTAADNEKSGGIVVVFVLRARGTHHGEQLMLPTEGDLII